LFFLVLLFHKDNKQKLIFPNKNKQKLII
jgi:hypothetical protein